MMSTSQSGVIACHSINTPRPEVTPQKSSPLKAWPAIKEWNRYCVLPTIGALYRPDLLPNPSGAISSISAQDWTLLEEMLEEIIRWFPNPEQFMSQLMPMFEEYHQMIGEYFQSHFGIEQDKQELQHALANVLTSLGEHETTKYPPTIGTSKLFPATSEIAGELDSANALSFIAELSNKMLSPDDTYSTEHEIGHLYSFQLTRPAITQFKATWSAIDDLLQEAAAGAHDDFWNKFVDLNNKLMNCLSKSLSLEELRANFWALSLLPPEMRTIFIDSIYGQENEYTSKKEREIFKSLQYLTGGRLMTALLLILLAECLDPFNPENKLEQVQDSLKVQNAHTWSDEQWASWFQSWSNKLDTWKIILSINDDINENTYTALPTAVLSGRPDGNVMAPCTESMRLPLFHESIRQQLYNRELARNLTCPFKGRRRTCCGFGHRLQNIWANLPNEGRRRLKPPSQVCLKYSP